MTKLDPFPIYWKQWQYSAKQNIEIISQPRKFGQEEGTWAIHAELALEINLGKQVVILGWVSLLLSTQKRGKIFCKTFLLLFLQSWNPDLQFKEEVAGICLFFYWQALMQIILSAVFWKRQNMNAYFYYSRLQWNQAHNHKFPTRGRSGLRSCTYRGFGSSNRKCLLDTLF